MKSKTDANEKSKTELRANRLINFKLIAMAEYYCIKRAPKTLNYSVTRDTRIEIQVKPSSDKLCLREKKQDNQFELWLLAIVLFNGRANGATTPKVI